MFKSYVQFPQGFVAALIDLSLHIGSFLAQIERMKGVRDSEHAVDEDGRVYSATGGAEPSSRAFHVAHLLSNLLKGLFLPSEYPHSVTEDYLPFQVYDSIQGIATYARSMLSNQSILIGLGVGAADASLFAASISMATKEAVSIFASLLVCSQSHKFDAYAKQWRLTADLFNDIAMTLDLFSPLAGQTPGGFLLFYILASVCRAICGVCGASTRISLTQHFALQQNAADVAACESAQETAVTLIGLLCGLGLTRISADFPAFAFICFAGLTCIHVLANIKAMRCLAITRMNTYRLTICFEYFLEHVAQKENCKKIPTPESVAHMEPLLPCLAWTKQSISVAPKLEKVAQEDPSVMKTLIKKVQESPDDDFWIVQGRKGMYTFLHQECTEGQDICRAYLEALCLLKRLPMTHVAEFLEQLNTSDSRWSLQNPLLLQTKSRVSLIDNLSCQPRDKKNA